MINQERECFDKLYGNPYGCSSNIVPAYYLFRDRDGNIEVHSHEKNQFVREEFKPREEFRYCR